MATFAERLAIIVDANVSGFTRAIRTVETDTKKLGTSVDKIGTQAQGLGGRLASFGKTAAFGLAGLGVAAVAFGDDFVRAAEESNKVTAQTDAVIKSMGLTATVSADQVAKLSEKLSLKSGIDDEVIQSGQNLLLTFRSLAATAGETGGNFDRATQAALDMSVALGTDMNAASIQVGKALNDPIRGLTTLRRAGIQFTEQQEAQIQTMVAVGDIAGAQTVILGELEAQFGGSAEAQATASDKLRVAWGNLQETLGEKLLPAVEAFSTWLVDTGIPAMEATIGFVDRNRTAFLALAAVVGGALVAAFGAWAVSVIIATGPILAIGAAVALVAVLVVKHFDKIKGAFMAAFNWLKSNWPLVTAILTGPIGIAVLAIIRNWDRIKAGAAAVVEAIRSFFATLPGRIAGAIGTIPSIFARAMARAWNAVMDFVDRIVRGIRSIPGKIGGVAGAIKDKLAGALGGVDLTPGFDLPGFGGFLQHGGPARAGRSYIVGERGPEVFIPSQSGTVIPSGAGGSRAVGSQTVVNYHMTFNGPTNSTQVIEAIKSYERSNGSGWRN